MWWLAISLTTSGTRGIATEHWHANGVDVSSLPEERVCVRVRPRTCAENHYTGSSEYDPFLDTEDRASFVHPCYRSDILLTAQTPPCG